MRITLQDMVLAALFTALTIVGAYFRLPNPLSPQVPFTLQVFFVLLAGAMLKPAGAGLSQILYILLGALGFPVFAGGQGGVGILLGPTGGYIFGFLVAAILISLLVGARDAGYARTLVAMIVGIIVIYLLGMVQLALVQKLSFVAAFVAGVLSFIPFDIFKAVVAALIAIRLKNTDAFKMSQSRARV